MKGKAMKKKVIAPVASILLLIMILSIFGAQLLFGQKTVNGGCGPGCKGTGKSVSELSCSWFSNGGVASFSCSVDYHGINNTMDCCCCP